MNTAKENSDDFFIGDFTESEKDIAAKHILEKQNAARWAYVISTVISVLSMLFVVYLIVGFVVSLPDFGDYIIISRLNYMVFRGCLYGLLQYA